MMTIIHDLREADALAEATRSLVKEYLDRGDIEGLRRFIDGQQAADESII